jgi:hypothetical protein
MSTFSYDATHIAVCVVIVGLWVGILNFWLDFTGMDWLAWLWLLLAVLTPYHSLPALSVPFIQIALFLVKPIFFLDLSSLTWVFIILSIVNCIAWAL